MGKTTFNGSSSGVFDILTTDQIQCSSLQGLNINATNGIIVNGPIQASSGNDLELKASSGKDIVCHHSLVPNLGALHSLGRSTQPWLTTYQDQLFTDIDTVLEADFECSSFNLSAGNTHYKIPIVVTPAPGPFDHGNNEIKIPQNGLYTLFLQGINPSLGITVCQLRLRRSEPPSFDFDSMELSSLTNSPWIEHCTYLFYAATTDRFEIWAKTLTTAFGNVSVKGKIVLIQPTY